MATKTYTDVEQKVNQPPQDRTSTDKYQKTNREIDMFKS